MRAVQLFSERLVNVWNSLPDSTDFSTLIGLGALFNESVLSNFLNVFSVMMFYVFYVFLLLCVCVSLLKSLYCSLISFTVFISF